MAGKDELETYRILVVDDETANLDALSRLLHRFGYRDVRTTSDPKAVLGIFEAYEPDLLLLDIRMPEMDGFDVLEQLEGVVPKDQYFPVLVLTGDLSRQVRERALAAGARDFITKPFDTAEVLLRIRNLLETRRLHLQLQAQNETLEDRVRERTRELAEAQVEILHRLALAAEYRDDITGSHAERVGVLSSLLARVLGWEDEEVRLIRRAATLHDVGKIGVPDAILMKPGPLLDREFELMKSHTVIGARILSGSRFPLLRMARDIALHHHEKWDGTGYSPGVAGEEIPLVGRIVAVADVFDSLTHERPYKRAFSVEEAVELIREGRGVHFDPQVVDAFETLVAAGDLHRLDEKVEASLDLMFAAPGSEPMPPPPATPILPGTDVSSRTGAESTARGRSTRRDPRDPPTHLDSLPPSGSVMQDGEGG